MASKERPEGKLLTVTVHHKDNEAVIACLNNGVGATVRLSMRRETAVAHGLASTGDGAALLAVIRAFIQVAIKKGATEVRYTVRADDPNLERFARIYRRLGAIPVSIAYRIPL